MALQSFTLDPNAAAIEDAGKLVRNETGGALAEGELVYIDGWDEANDRFTVTKAVATALSTATALIMRGSLADVTNGTAYRTHRLTGQNTAAAVEGDPVYLSPATPGTFTFTAPTGADEVVQRIGRVAVVHASTGVIEFDLVGADAVVAVGTGELQANAVSNAKLAAAAARDNLDAIADTARKYVRTGPGPGEFKVIEVQRDATGKLEVTYDDVAEP